MLLKALLGAVPLRGEADQAALAVHATMLEHGFVCVGTAEVTQPGDVEVPVAAAGSDGAVALQVVPSGWNAAPDSFTFAYVHPLNGPGEAFTLKAVLIGGALTVHAASSLEGAPLLTATLAIDRAAGAAVAAPGKLQEWQESAGAGIARKLLDRSQAPGAKGLEKALKGDAAVPAGAAKRPAPEDERPGPDDSRRGPPSRPIPDPFVPFGPAIIGDPTFPLIGGPPGRLPGWAPDGNLFGPRHPAWGGGVMPGRGGGTGTGGMLPRFDPLGPGGGIGMEPDADHFVPPGPTGFPAFQGGATGRDPRRYDPDGMFIL